MKDRGSDRAVERGFRGPNATANRRREIERKDPGGEVAGWPTHSRNAPPRGEARARRERAFVCTGGYCEGMTAIHLRTGHFGGLQKKANKQEDRKQVENVWLKAALASRLQVGDPRREAARPEAALERTGVTLSALRVSPTALVLRVPNERVEDVTRALHAGLVE